MDKMERRNERDRERGEEKKKVEGKTNRNWLIEARGGNTKRKNKILKWKQNVDETK